MKKIALITLYGLAALVLLSNLVFVVRDSLVVQIEDLPEGQQVGAVKSPDGRKTLKLYSVKNSLGSAVRAEVVEKGKIARNVYWQVDTDRTDAYWLNRRAVIINGVTIDVGAGDSYDCRSGLSILREGSIKGEFDEPLPEEIAP